MVGSNIFGALERTFRFAYVTSGAPYYFTQVLQDIEAGILPTAFTCACFAYFVVSLIKLVISWFAKNSDQ